MPTSANNICWKKKVKRISLSFIILKSYIYNNYSSHSNYITIETIVAIITIVAIVAINYNNKSQTIVTVKNPLSQPQHTCPSVCALSSIRDQPNIPLKMIRLTRATIGVVP